MKHLTVKKRLGATALVLSLALCGGLLAGCSTQTTQESEEPSEEIQESEEPSAPANEDAIGQVTGVSEDGVISLEYYEAAEPVEDYAALDPATLTDAGESGEVTPDSDARYYVVDGGALADAAAEDVTAGSMIAVTAGEDGVQEIILLTDGAAQSGEASVSQVTALGEDGSLTVSQYQRKADAEDGAITDYAAVDLEQYEDTGVSRELTISDTAIIQVAENGTLSDALAEDIAVGDMLIVYTDDTGTQVVVIYPAEPAAE